MSTDEILVLLIDKMQTFFAELAPQEQADFLEKLARMVNE